MKKFKYFLKRLFKIDYHRFFYTFKKIKAESNRSTAYLLFDMLVCAIKYNAGYMDYKIAQMYKLNSKQRETVITRGISNDIVRRMNPKDKWYIFDNKALFNSTFKENIQRKWLVINTETSYEDFCNFTNGLNSFIYKPLEGSSGQGIQKYSESDWKENTQTFLSNLQLKGSAIIEELVVQHPILAALNASSVNTIRVATLLGDKQEGIVYAFIRIGNGSVMDNVDCGGMAARVDLESGTILTVGADKAGNVFEYHPTTHKRIIGVTIPFWKETKLLCMQAAKKVPEMRFIAWDVAITEKGPVFIEGNSFPSHAIPQFSAHYPDGIGILQEFQKFIDI